MGSTLISSEEGAQSPQTTPPLRPSSRIDNLNCSTATETTCLVAGLPKTNYTNDNDFFETNKSRDANFKGESDASSSVNGCSIPQSPYSLRGRLGFRPVDTEAGEIDWLSIVVVYWITLVSEAARGLILPSAWPYLKSLGGSKQTLGIFVAVFTFGRVAATVPQGYLSDKFSSASVLIAAACLQILGHSFYVLSPSIPLLIASRGVVGFASATVSVCRAHFTRAIPHDVRTYHFAWLSATQFIGFVVLPGVGGLLTNLPRFVPIPYVVFNEYTYPAIVLILCNTATVAAVYHLYLDPPPPGTANAPVRKGTRQRDSVRQTSPDFTALSVCLIVNVSFRGVVAELETVSVPLMMEIYGLGFDRASYFITLVGLIGLAVYFAVKPLSRRFSDRDLVVAGLGFAIAGSLPLGFPPLMKEVSLPIFIVFVIVMWSFSYPIGQTAMLSLFSKILAGLPAGGFLGLFSACGAFGRMLFAVFAVTIWTSFGPSALFATMCGYVALALALTIHMYRRLVPASQPFPVSDCSEKIVHR